MPWSLNDMPSDLSHITAMITGVTSGIGLVTSKELAKRKAKLVLVGRNVQKLTMVAQETKELGATYVEYLICDLSDLDSVRACASSFSGVEIDVLLLNAGLSMDSFVLTKQGFETSFVANHLGHFLLTGLLLPKIKSKIISVASGAHRFAKGISWNVINGESPDSFPPGTGMYSETKLMNLLFVEELNRHLIKVGSGIVAVGAHPGLSKTNFIAKYQPEEKIMSLILKFFGQSQEMGAMPLLMAVVDESKDRNNYYAPKSGIISFEFKGNPSRNGTKTKLVRDEALAKKLWEESERLAGFKYSF